jgi:hypothetical protein
MWIAPSYPRSIAIGQVVRLIHAPWNPKLVTAEVRRDPMSGDLRNIRMVGRKLLMGSRGGVSEWAEPKGKRRYRCSVDREITIQDVFCRNEPSIYRCSPWCVLHASGRVSETRIVPVRFRPRLVIRRTLAQAEVFYRLIYRDISITMSQSVTHAHHRRWDAR